MNEGRQITPDSRPDSEWWIFDPCVGGFRLFDSDKDIINIRIGLWDMHNVINKKQAQGE